MPTTSRTLASVPLMDYADTWTRERGAATVSSPQAVRTATLPAAPSLLSPPAGVRHCPGVSIVLDACAFHASELADRPHPGQPGTTPAPNFLVKFRHWRRRSI